MKAECRGYVQVGIDVMDVMKSPDSDLSSTLSRVPELPTHLTDPS